MENVSDRDRTKEQLVAELVELRRRVAKLEALESEHKHTEAELVLRNQQLVESKAQWITINQPDSDPVLVNLVSNAIKFTKQGTVTVHGYCPDPAHWVLQVSDTGPGIPPEAQSYIFEPFRQVDGSITREHKGAGLGLSIVKQLTDLMGGQISLDSDVGRGSTFTVLLPLTPNQEKDG